MLIDLHMVHMKVDGVAISPWFKIFYRKPFNADMESARRRFPCFVVPRSSQDLIPSPDSEWMLIHNLAVAPYPTRKIVEHEVLVIDSNS